MASSVHPEKTQKIIKNRCDLNRREVIRVLLCHLETMIETNRGAEAEVFLSEVYWMYDNQVYT